MRRRARVMLVLLLASAASPGHACGPLLVSGFDDVLRQADNTGLWRAARRLLQPDRGYAGMPELYHALACARDAPRFVVVSAITTSLAPRARRFLAREDYPSSTLQFRRWLLQWSPEGFKRARFEALLARHPDRQLLVVLDNSETSIRLGRWLLREHPTRIAAIYLRETVAFEAPPGLTPFVTAFDIARHEHAAGRLTAADVRRVAAAILAARSDADVIPTYAQCPTAPASCAVAEAGIHDHCERLRAHVQRVCALRRGTGKTGR